MKIVAAYLMASLTEQKEVTKESIARILDAVGIKADNAEIDLVLAKLKGKSLDELIAAGSKKFASIGGGGGAAAAPAAAAAAGPAKKEEKKAAPKKEEPEEEPAQDFSLFD